MADQLNLVRMVDEGNGSERLYPLRSEGIIADAVQTTGAPVILKSAPPTGAGEVWVTTSKTAGHWTAFSSGVFVSLQAATPGVADTGNWNISGVGIAKYLSATSSTSGTDATFCVTGIDTDGGSGSGGGVTGWTKSGIGVFGFADGSGTGVEGASKSGWSGFFKSSSNANSAPTLVTKLASGQATSVSIFSVQDSGGLPLVTMDGIGGIVVNEQGNNADTRMEGDTDQNLLFLDASADSIGIGTASPVAKLYVSSSLSSYPAITGISSGATANGILGQSKNRISGLFQSSYSANTYGTVVARLIASQTGNNLYEAQDSSNNVLFYVGNAGTVNTTDVYKVDGTQVVTNQQAAVADAAGGATIDAEARTAINDLLARLRTHGLIAT